MNRSVENNWSQCLLVCALWKVIKGFMSRLYNGDQLDGCVCVCAEQTLLLFTGNLTEVKGQNFRMQSHSLFDCVALSAHISST